MDVLSIYVMPTEEGLPPRALVQTGDGTPLSAVYEDEKEAWTIEGEEVPDELSQAITDHARNLGVESFL